MQSTPPPKKVAPGIVDHSNGRVARAIILLRELGPRGLLTRARQHGVNGSYHFLARNVRHQVAHTAALVFDRLNGVDTAGSVQLGSLEIVGPNRDLGNEAVSTSPMSFNWLMKRLSAPRQTTYIDIGCGKGRTLLLASHYFVRSTGVEFAKELVTVARSNVRSYAGRHPKGGKMEVFCKDAGEFRFPPGPILVYFYNPFSEALFRQVIANLGDSLSKDPRPCTVVYATGMATLDWARSIVLETGTFRESEQGKTPGFLDAIRRLDYAIFRANL